MYCMCLSGTMQLFVGGVCASYFINENDSLHFKCWLLIEDQSMEQPDRPSTCIIMLEVLSFCSTVMDKVLPV